MNLLAVIPRCNEHVLKVDLRLGRAQVYRARSEDTFSVWLTTTRHFNAYQDHKIQCSTSRHHHLVTPKNHHILNTSIEDQRNSKKNRPSLAPLRSRAFPSAIKASAVIVVLWLLTRLSTISSVKQLAIAEFGKKIAERTLTTCQSRLSNTNLDSKSTHR